MIRKALFVCVILLIVGWAVYKISANYELLRHANIDMNYLAAAVGATSFALVLNAFAVVLLLRASGSVFSARKIFFYNMLLQPLKYLPAGSAINATSQSMAFAKIEGIRIVDAYLIPVISLCIQAAVGLIMYGGYQIAHEDPSIWLICTIIAAILSIMLAMNRRILQVLARWMAKKTKAHLWSILAEWAEVPFRWTYLCGAVVIFALFWVAAGISLFFLASSIGPLGVSEFPRFVALASVSVVMGYAAFFMPAGIGAREGVLIVLLGNILTQPWPTIVAILSRIAWILAELTNAAIVSMASRWFQQESRGEYEQE